MWIVEVTETIMRDFLSVVFIQGVDRMARVAYLFVISCFAYSVFFTSIVANGQIQNWQTQQVILGTEGIVLEPGVTITGWGTPSHNLDYADFSGLDLHGGNLSDNDLMYAHFVQTNLTGVNLSGTFLIHADLTGAILNQADLSGADLLQANLSNADLRGETATEVFKERYKIRSGIEGTNSGLKRRTGLGRLRVRGWPAVSHAIYLKIAGWNLLRAAVCATIREIVYARAKRAVLGLDFARLRGLQVVGGVRKGLQRSWGPSFERWMNFSAFSQVA
jgi:uncharacterized protein YjbI with pentapeptide repeats